MQKFSLKKSHFFPTEYIILTHDISQQDFTLLLPKNSRADEKSLFTVKHQNYLVSVLPQTIHATKRSKSTSIETADKIQSYKTWPNLLHRKNPCFTDTPTSSCQHYPDNTILKIGRFLQLNLPSYKEFKWLMEGMALGVLTSTA